MLVLYNHPKFSFSQPEPEEGRGRRPVLGLPPRFAELVGQRAHLRAARDERLEFRRDQLDLLGEGERAAPLGEVGRGVAAEHLHPPLARRRVAKLCCKKSRQIARVSRCSRSRRRRHNS